MSRSTLWRVLAIALPVLAAIAAPLPSVDLTYLLRGGQEILATGAIPTVDSWTFSAFGRPWLDQPWGSEVLLQLVFGATGWTGLVLVRAALVGIAFGLLLETIRRRAPRLGPLATSVVVIAAFVVAANGLALRAQLFAIVLFAATLFVLAIRADRRRAVWLIPLFALLWANLHATFLFAPALCGLAWLSDLYDAMRGASTGDGHRPRGMALHRMLVIGVVALLATLVNPFGLADWGYVSTVTSNPTIALRVSEWRPPSPATIPGVAVWVSVVAVAILVAVRIRVAWRAQDGGAPRRRGAFRSTARVPWPAILTLALFGGLALATGRGTVWWPFVAAFVVAPWLSRGAPVAALTPVPPVTPTPTLSRSLNLAIVGALLVTGVALLPAWRAVGQASVPEGTLTYAPQQIAASLSRYVSQGAPCPAGNATGRAVWNPQAWGSFLEWAAPCFRYAVDARIELFSPATWADVDRVESAAPGWDRVLDADHVEIVLTMLDGDQRLATALRASGTWDELPMEGEGSIWVRRQPAASVTPWVCPPGYGTKVCQ